MSGEREAVHAAADAMVDYAQDTFWRTDSAFASNSRHSYQAAAAWLHEHTENLDSYAHPEAITHMIAATGSESLCGDGDTITTTTADVTCGWCRVKTHLAAALDPVGEGSEGAEAAVEGPRSAATPVRRVPSHDDGCKDARETR